MQVAAALRPLRFALLDAACFAGLPEPAALEALSRLLQAVSGSPYPPALHHITRLWQALLPGRLGAAYEGGGCRLRRLPQCGGRYLVCVSSRDRAAAEEHLAELSSSAAGQERKEAVRRDGQWQGQRHHGERQQAAAAGALLDAAAALAEPIAGG